MAAAPAEMSIGQGRGTAIGTEIGAVMREGEEATGTEIGIAAEIEIGTEIETETETGIEAEGKMEIEEEDTDHKILWKIGSVTLDAMMTKRCKESTIASASEWRKNNWKGGGGREKPRSAKKDTTSCLWVILWFGLAAGPRGWRGLALVFLFVGLSLFFYSVLGFCIKQTI